VRARYWLLSEERSAPSYHLAVNGEVEERLRDVVRKIARGIDEGTFPGKPGKRSWNGFDNCTFCDFDRLCPRDRRRQWELKKRASELADIVSLDEGPVDRSLADAVLKGPPSLRSGL
jgi:hypothetical protein